MANCSWLGILILVQSDSRTDFMRSKRRFVISVVDLFLAAHNAPGIALHGGAKRLVHNPELVSRGNDQASIRLFDPQPGAMAGMSQELELK